MSEARQLDDGPGRSGRATATVLFTDLVGSTELRAHLGEQPAEELRRRHDRLLAGVVEAHCGHVIKGLGDGIMAAFMTASDGVAAAVAVQQAIDRENRSQGLPVPLAVRVGLSAGDVTFEGGDCFGTPVIEAARLCAAALAGQILVSDMVRWLVRGGGQRFSSQGMLQLKGLPDPVATSQIGWEPLPQSSYPLPTLLTDVGRIFVGRDGELDLLSRFWKEAAAGQRRVALLAGEPGVGKTRLGAELARLAHEGGGTVLAGRCDEDLGVPFQPFVEALRHFVDHAGTGELAERLGRHAGELERLLPGLRGRLPDAPPMLRSDPETERYRLFEAVTGWLSCASDQEPVLLILDDLHWAAKPTLLLLRHITCSPERMALLIVGTYRDTELHHDHPLLMVLADLRRQGGVERLQLAGFDQAAVAEFMTRAGGRELDDDGLALVQAIHAETDGNPFFVREILRHLAETGAIVERDGRLVSHLGVGEWGIPEGVRDVVGRRVARLSDEASRVLRLAAVMGTEFDLPVLIRAGDMDGEGVLSAVEEATAARLLLAVPGRAARHRFAHALVRDTLYDQVSPTRRVAMHRRVAEAIEDLHAGAVDDHLPALAHHRARASTGAAEWARAADYAARAGDRALTQLAHHEAVAYYGQALELREVAGAAVDTRQAQLLISLGEAQRQAGDPTHRDTLLRAAALARDLHDGGLLARAALANRRGLFSPVGTVDRDRVAALEAALEAAGPPETPERARLLAALSTELHFAADQRRVDLGREALRIARRLGEPLTLADALEAVWLAVRDPGALSERSALAAELATVAPQVGDPVREFNAGFIDFLTASEAGDMARGDEALATCGRIADDVGQPVLRWRAAVLRSHRASVDGRLDVMERHTVEAVRLGQTAGQPDTEALSDVFYVRLLQGRPEEAVEMLRPLAEQFKGAQVHLAGLAWACSDAGRTEEAREIVERLRGKGFTRLERHYLWLGTLVFLARPCARLEDAAAAEELYDLLLPHRSAMAVAQSVWMGPVAYVLGLLATKLGRYRDADTHFAGSTAIHDRAGAGGLLAHTHWDWACMLLARHQPGDVERAADHLHQARETAQALRLHDIERRADALLHDLT